MEVMKNKCKLCNKHLRDDIPHKMCKIKACTEKLSIEMEEYENIITKLRAEYQEKHQENVKLKGKVHELTEQIKSERRIIEKRKAGPSLDLFAEFDDDISRNQSLNKAIYVENTQNDDELINIKAEPVTNSTDETSNFSNLEQKIQNSKSPLIKKSKLSLTKSTTPLRVSNDNTNTYRKWISKDKLDDKKMQSFHRPIEDLLNNTKLLETKENNSNLRKSNRKTSNRSIFNPKKMKQSTLSQYTSNTETLEKNLLNNFDETDETYCEDLIMPSQSSKKYTRSFKIIKKEKLPIKIHTKLTDLEETNSLLILPTPVDDVIEIPDSMVMNELTDCLSEESVDIFNGIFAAKQKLKNEEKCNEEKNNCNKLAFKCSPIRKKSEKAKLPGFACADCEQYYSVVGYNMTAEQLQARKNKCSKHRQNVRLHDTPEGFWQPFFTPTQDEKYPKCTINEKDLHLHADKYEKR